MKPREVTAELKLWGYVKVDIHPWLGEKIIFIDSTKHEGLWIEYDESDRKVSCPGTDHVDVDPLSFDDTLEDGSLAKEIEGLVLKSRAYHSTLEI